MLTRRVSNRALLGNYMALRGVHSFPSLFSSTVLAAKALQQIVNGQPGKEHVAMSLKCWPNNNSLVG